MADTTPNLGLYTRGPVASEKRSGDQLAFDWDFDLNMNIIDAAITAAQDSVTDLGALLQEDPSNKTSQFDSISNRQFITADGQYNASVGVVRISTGLLLAYFKGTAHTSPVSVGWKTSTDNGATWSSEQTNTPYYGGPFVWNNHKMPGGTIVSSGSIGVGSNGYWYSTDNGVSWNGPVALSGVSFQTRGFKIGSVAYLATAGTSLIDGGSSAFLYKSTDDGLTWTRFSEIRNAGEPQISETGVCYLGNNRVMAIHRDSGADTNTYVHFSEDGGLTWGAAQDYTTQLGALGLPQLQNLGNVLLLTARQSNQFQVVMYLSYDNGVTWSNKIVLDTYATSNINGGYTWPLVLDATRVLVPYYADCTVAGEPDIKSVVLNFKGGAIVDNAL